MLDLTLEVGTEEMPAGAIDSALTQLKAAFEAGLREARIPASSVQVCGTPRRLIVIATGLPSRQEDILSEVKGPSKAVAFGADGKPTGAALGFAKKQGVAVEDLEILATDQGDYILAKVHIKGKETVDAVAEIISSALKGLSFPKMMRWGRGEHKFVRPVRWIFCMLGDTVVPLNFAGVTAGNKSRGHRFLAPEEFEIANSSILISELQNRFVMVDKENRSDEIRRQSNELAATLGGEIPWDAGLLDENTWLVEWPTAVLGSFDSAYLDLPRPVLVTAMKKHQRYFPVEDSRGALLPNFVAIRSGDNANIDIVRDGYERVLAARFNDAQYFYNQDKENSLDDMAKQLERLVFQEKLGTYAEKRVRLMGLAQKMASNSDSEVDSRDSRRAAEICKADLVSRMVIELPALQGVMGREYALKHEKQEVADAILGHYYPRFAGDKLPETPMGRLLAIADRIDTLVGYIGLGILPTGSSDPFGLRRAAQGLVQLALSDGDDWILNDLVHTDFQLYGVVLTSDSQTLRTAFFALIRQRLIVALEEQGLRLDLIEASLNSVDDSQLTAQSVAKRAKQLQVACDTTNFTQTVQAASRVANILRSSEYDQRKDESINGELFEDEAERELNRLADGSEQAVTDFAFNRQYSEMYDTLAKLSPAVDHFFDKVMVMAENTNVRANRLALLTKVNKLYRHLADFTKIEN